MKELFPLNTFQQDAVLKRLEELREANEDIVDGSEHLFENITDSQGHKRFIEGEITMDVGASEITKKYGKWSLSGTHLLVVLAGDIPNETVITAKAIAYFDVPEWIFNKIIPVDNTGHIESKQVNSYSPSHSSTQNLRLDLVKSSHNRIVIGIGSITLTDDRGFRGQFDLLIDNE